MKKIIELEQLTKAYTKDKRKISVLEDISYSFEMKKFYVIMGESGSGKTTLIQLLGLFLNDFSGNIVFDSVGIKKLSENEKAEIRNKKIGFVFQSFYLNPNMNAYENVILPIYLQKNIPFKAKKELAYKKLKEFGLEGRELHYPRELSGGEQQRVSIARALINDPQVILADEPTGSLDYRNEELILRELRKLADAGKCVIVVSHSKDVKKYADKILFIKNKKLTERKIKK